MSDTSFNGIGSLCGTLLGLSLGAVGLRFYARVQQKTRILADDVLMVCALVMFIGLTSLIFFGMEQRLIGVPAPKDPKLIEEHAPEYGKIFDALDAIGVCTLGFTKLSALYFFRRLFVVKTHRSLFDIVTMAMIVIVILWQITFFFFTLFNCGPHLSALWTPSEKHRCWSIYPYFLAVAVSDFILDLFILILPIPKIWSLSTTPARKIALSGVFLLAFVGLAASIARLALFVQLENAGKKKNDIDPYNANTQSAYFITLEAGLNIIAVNLPTLWYFTKGVTAERVLRSMRSMVSLGSGRNSTGSDKSTGRKEAVGPGSEPQPMPIARFSTSELEVPHTEGNGKLSETYATDEELHKNNTLVYYETHDLP